MLKKFTLVILFICSLQIGFAQKLRINIEDPLQKPETWSRLKAMPDNDVLWNEYLGKDWSELSKDELKRFYQWHNQLVEEKKEREKAMQAVDQAIIASYKAESPIKRTTISAIERLGEDLETNFVIIEDHLAEAFAEFGGKYVYYNQKHPKNDWDKDAWLKEQLESLNVLKKNKLGAVVNN